MNGLIRSSSSSSLKIVKRLGLRKNQGNLYFISPVRFPFVSHNAKSATASAKGRTSHPASDSPWKRSWLCPWPGSRVFRSPWVLLLQHFYQWPGHSPYRRMLLPSFSSAALICLSASSWIEQLYPSQSPCAMCVCLGPCSCAVCFHASKDSPRTRY